MEQHLGATGLKLADHDRDEHQFVKEHLHKLEGLKPGTDEYESTMKAVMGHLRHHNDSEEENDLPPLEKKLGDEGSKAAAASFSRTKKFVPTRYGVRLSSKICGC